MFKPRAMFAIAKGVLTHRSPFYVQFYIIGKCNLKCRQCNIVETNSRIVEMPLDQIRDVAKNLRKVGAGIVLLTGGEPFMRCDLPQIVEIFTREGLNVRLQTAGTHYATEEKLRACYEAGGRDINVSLDSLDLPTFDYINAVPGSAKNAIETIERISRIFRKDSAILSFGTVLSQFNYLEIPAILEFARRIGWFVSLVPVHIAQTQHPKGFRSFDRLFEFKPNQYGRLDTLADELVVLKANGAPLFDSERFIRSAVSFLKGNGPTWRKNGICDSPNLYFSIRPNGDFTTCCDYTLENPPKVFDENFPKKYKSREIERRPDVQKIIRNCSGCHYGSYPEVTLSVRDPRALIERVSLVMQSGRGRLSDALVQSDFLSALTDVKAAFPDIYPKDGWLMPELKALVHDWSDGERRKEILRHDNEVRIQQNRVRGKGEDVLIGPETKQ